MSTDSDTRVIIPRTRPSCTHCQRSKKRCSREKPQCSTCVRHGRDCVYTGNTTVIAGVVDHIPSASTSYQPPDISRSTEDNFPVVFFLDSILFQRSLNKLPDLDPSLNDHLPKYIGHIAPDPAFIKSYFATIHPSIPFLSRKEFRERILSPLSSRRPAHTLLIASMKLLASPLPEQGPRCSAYYAIKSSLIEAENSGILDLRVLQAIILIALFEIGHAIYPAAYMTVGYCVRYGSALGIHKAVEQYSEEEFSASESEERRRSWWTILLFDRFISLGSADKPILTTDPSGNSLLPIDDATWEENRESFAPVRKLFEPPTTTMGRFSLTAQAAVLLGRVFRSIQESPIQEGFWQNDVEVLDRTIVALTKVSLEEGRFRGIGVCSPSTICYSARLLLHDKERHVPGKTPHEITDRLMSQDFKNDIAASMLRLAYAIRDAGSCAGDEITPLCIEAIYRSAVFYGKEYSRTGAYSALVSCEAIKEALALISKRWRVAASYVQLIDARIISGI